MKKFKLSNHIYRYVLSELELNEKTLLPDVHGEGLFFDHPDGGKIKSYLRRDSRGYREMELEITSLRGAIGAVHYYAKLKDHALHFTRIEDEGNKSSIGGYSLKNVPRKYTELSIDVMRPVTQKDIDHDKDYGREEFMISKIGDLARGFWTEADAIETGIAVFKALCKGKWKLVIDPYSGKKVKNVYIE